MDTSGYLVFLAVSVALIVIPGPNVLVVVSAGMTHGRAQGRLVAEETWL